MELIARLILYHLIIKRFDFHWFYRWYIPNSAAWKSKRAKIIAREKCRCRHCHRSGRLEVHHLNYDRLGHERLSDLVALCPKCHRAADIARKYRNW